MGKKYRPYLYLNETEGILKKFIRKSVVVGRPVCPKVQVLTAKVDKTMKEFRKNNKEWHNV